MNVLALRLYQAKEKQLEMCDELLTKAGVPEWVLLADSDVPANSTPCRLAWFLARRKDVKPDEVDHALLREMEENLRAVKAWREQQTDKKG